MRFPALELWEDISFAKGFGLPCSGNRGRSSTREWCSQCGQGRRKRDTAIRASCCVNLGTLSSHNKAQRHLSTFCRSPGVPRPPSFAKLDYLSQSSALPQSRGLYYRPSQQPLTPVALKMALRDLLGVLSPWEKYMSYSRLCHYSFSDNF